MEPLFRGLFDSGRPSKWVSHHERQLQAILTEFVAYYDRDRPHRSLVLRTPDFTARAQAGALGGRPILGGRHHSYEWAA
jgi:transposase InsO family protein